MLTPSLVFREMPEQRKRRREPDGEIADEEESAAFHLISCNSLALLREWGRRFPGKKACNHSLPRRPLVASAAKGDSRHHPRGTADLNKKAAGKER